MRKKIIIGNWKMNPLTAKEAGKWLTEISKSVSRIKNTEIVICPPLVYLTQLKKLSRKILFGAQNAFWGDVGPHTGEVSTEMLYELGAKYVILGHSDRRAFGETDMDVNKKIKSALASGLVPVVCIGEKDRDGTHEYLKAVKNQTHECLKGISKDSIVKVIVVYEPVWAISSSQNHKDATSAECLEMVIFIRKILHDMFGSNTSKIRILYGGSANEKDALDFLQNGGVDGFLPGRASLDPKKFSEIIKIAENLAK